MHAKAYVTSSQLYNWQFTADELVNHRQDCNVVAQRRLKQQHDDSSNPESLKQEVQSLSADDELNIVKRYLLIMKTLFLTFNDPPLPADVFGFAASYFKRFYLKHSVMDFFPREIMLTSLYLACKSADFPLGLQHFISHIPRNRERYSEFIVNSELFLMEALHYDLWIHTPYRPFLGLVVDLVAFHRTRGTGLGDDDTVDLAASLKKDGYEMIHTWFQTDLCLTTPPSQFALAVLMELGRFRPELDVEVFVKDEVCGCNLLKDEKSKNKIEDDEEEEDEEKEKDDEDETTDGPKIVQPTAEQRWAILSDRLDQIHTTVAEFEFLTDLSRFGEEEILLEECRNPLYDPLSEEYAAAKERANSMMAIID